MLQNVKLSNRCNEISAICPEEEYASCKLFLIMINIVNINIYHMYYIAFKRKKHKYRKLAA